MQRHAHIQTAKERKRGSRDMHRERERDKESAHTSKGRCSPCTVLWVYACGSRSEREKERHTGKLKHGERQPPGGSAWKE